MAKKKKKNEKNEIVEYVKTVTITLLTVTVLVSIIVFDIAKSAHSRMSNVIERIASRFKTESISELLEQERKRPDDYMINVKLAGLYETIEQFFKSDEEYKKALTKAPRSEYVLYRYALFCASQGRFDEAIILVENIPDSTNRGSLSKKLAVYQYMGDKLLEKGDYLNATKIYSAGSKYGRILNDRKSVEIKKRLARASLLLADEQIEEHNSEQATLVLENLLKVYNSPEARYKLALIYRPTDPKRSAKIMDDLMKTNPELINFDIYYSILQDLIKKSTAEGNQTDTNYYTFKQEKMKRYVVRNVVFSDEFVVENAQLTGKLGSMGKKILSFDVKHSASSKVNSLILKTVISFPNSKPVTKEILVDFDEGDEKGIQRGRVLIEGWEYKPDDLNNFSDHAHIEIYAKKNNRFGWILIQELNVLIK